MVGRCIELYRNVYLTNFLRAVSLPGDGVWIPVVLVIVAAALILFLRKDRLFAVVILLTPLVGNVVKYVLKNTYNVPRPGVFGCPVLTSFDDKYAFPSGHTIFYTIFFGLLTYYSAKHWRELWAKILLPISAMLILTIGYSRIYLGAHWYLDVIAGYIVGGAILAIAIIVFDYLSGGKNAHKNKIVYDASGNIQKAGAIISRNHGREILLTHRFKQNDYSFPKGHLEVGETPRKAMEREVLEETGCKVRVVKKLPDFNYSYPESGKVVVKMFLAECVSEGRGVESNEESLWVEREKVTEILSYDNLKEYFEKYLGESDAHR